MFTNTVVALSGALLSVVAAVPMAGEHHHHQHHARDYVWETVVQEVVVTLPVTRTVWVEPGETSYVQSMSTTAPAAPAYTPPSSSSAPAAPAYTPKSSSSSAPAAPAYTPKSSSSTTPVAPAYTPPSSTSVYVAPAPKTTAPAAPAYTAPASSAPAAAAPAPAPAYSSQSSGSSAASAVSNGLTGVAAAGKTYTGDLTWYQVGMGACGWTNTQTEAIVAISEKIFDAYSTGNPNTNPLCGKYVTITGKNGSPYKAKIVDRCTGCATSDLDLSQDFFNQCTEYGDGRVSGMKWTFD